MIHAARILCDVLFAGLWQGALISLPVLCVLHFTGRRLNAATRCTVLQIVLAAIVLVPLLTTMPAVISQNATITGHGVSATTGSSAPVVTAAAWSPLVELTLSEAAVLSIAAGWCLGTLLCLLPIAASVLQMLRLKRRSIRREIYNGVAVYVSSEAAVPLAFGFVDPFIIVPKIVFEAGRGELESVLAHEKAHIERRDAAANFCERLLLCALFFNPFAHAVRKRIDFEREAACDDRAVASAGNVELYLQTLADLTLRHNTASSPAAACGVLGFGNAVVQRIERLADPNRISTTFISSKIIGGFMLSFIAFALILRGAAPAVAFSKPAPAPVVQIASNACRQDAIVVQAARPSGSVPPGSVTVDVHLSATGAVTRARAIKSSGNAVLDRTALRLATNSKYEPAVRNCKPAASTYYFMFNSDGK